MGINEKIMRILLANKFYYTRGGDCICAINLEELLKKNGHEVAIFAMDFPKNLQTPWSKYFPSEIRFKPGIGMIEAFTRPFGTSEVRRKFNMLLDDFHPDVVHVHNIHSQLSPIIVELAHQRGIKVVWTLHDYKLLCPRYDCLRNGTEVCEECFADKHRVVKYKCMKNSCIASMLAYNPYYLFDVGFQLSYLAVFFILFLVPRFKEWIVVRNPLLAMPWEWITVSIAAQIGTALLCFYYFGQFSTVFLFTNLPVTLLAMFLIPFAFLWLGYPVDFYGYDWIQKIVEGLVHGMVRVVDVFSVMPYATITGRFSFFEMLGGYGFLVLCLIYMKIREPKVLLAALTLLLIISVKILIELFLIAGN